METPNTVSTSDSLSNIINTEHPSDLLILPEKIKKRNQFCYTIFREETFGDFIRSLAANFPFLLTVAILCKFFI